ncbi:Methyl-CpG-binding domain protein 4 [Lachnellula arida]|uniref:Methyl-CpG-binding domain protein 4 n=1 Tax=Lachnellula arida TaxID=1316785 RepID=A0A8T9BCC2_9HELO|nr:Methyl-CpG-binding domain protein 4 [Lachnellula arida]
MSSPSRVWKGADSSNDARGSGSSSDDDDNLDLPPTATAKSESKPLSEAKRGGDAPGKKGKKGALKGRTEIPSSTADESSQSQKKKIKELERIEESEDDNHAPPSSQPRPVSDDEDNAPPSSQPRPVSSDEQDQEGALAEVQPEVKTTRRKRKRDKKEKHPVEDSVTPQLQASQTWYEGDDAGKTVVEVSEPKAEKVKKALGVEDIKKKEEYAGQKAAKRAKMEPSEDTHPQKPAGETAANQDHDEVSVIGSSKSGAKTKSQRRREKKARAKAAKQGEATSAPSAPAKAAKQGETTSAPSAPAVRTHEQKMASDELKRAQKKNKIVPPTAVAAAEVPAAKNPDKIVPPTAVAVAEVTAAKNPDKEATLQRFTQNSGLPKNLKDSIAKSRQAVEAAKANVPVRIVVEEKGWKKERKRQAEADKKKEKNSKKQVTAEETEEMKKEKSGRRKRKRNQNSLPEGETGQPLEEGEEAAVKDSPETAAKPVQPNKSKDVVAAPETQDDLEDGEKPKKKARKSRKPKTPGDGVVPEAEVMDGVEQTTTSDQVNTEAEAMDGVEQTTTSDQVNTEAPSEKKRRSRGKKPKKENGTEPEPTEPGIDQTLTELPNTNTKKVKAGRRDRVKKERSSTDAMDLDTEIANGDAKGDQGSASGSQFLDMNSTGEDDIEGGLEQQTNASKSQETDVPQLEPPSTPTRSIKVDVYTPSKTWIPVDGNHVTPNRTDEDGATLQTQEDDNSSISSPAQPGPINFDHSRDDFNNIQPPREHPRRPSTPPPDDVHSSIEVVSAQYKARKRRASKATSANSFTPVRDKKGRFSSTVKSEPGYESDVEYTPSFEEQCMRSMSFAKSYNVRDSEGRFTKRGRSEPAKDADYEPMITKRRAHSVSSTKSGVLRDSRGRFASRSNSISVHDTGLEPRRRRAYSMSSAKSLGIVRDSKGIFASRGRSESRSGHSDPTTAKRRASTATSEGRSRGYSRDQNGRFSKTLPSTKREPVDAASPSIPQEQGSLVEEPESKRLQLTGKDEATSTESGIKKIKAKPKRAPAKSPYFMTPPVTPSKSNKTRVPKTEKGESSKSSLATPKKEDDDISSPQDSPKKRSPGGLVSCIPFPPLASSTFGLIQEKLANDPFRLLIAVTFLIRTHGKHAIPVFYSLMKQYPTPESLIDADTEDIVSIIRHLGLQNQRAATYQMYAKIWLEDAPTKGKRYVVRGYPSKDAGRDIKKGEILPDDDPRSAWEIGHMTQGPYAMDSWRIFCRDVLRGVATGWNGEGSTDEGFQPEWMRVVPEDKELRAYLRWMWLKEGFEWDPFTGEKEVAGEGLMRAAIEGRIAWDDAGGMRILDEVVDGDVDVLQLTVDGI